MHNLEYISYFYIKINYHQEKHYKPQLQLHVTKTYYDKAKFYTLSLVVTFKNYFYKNLFCIQNSYENKP